MSTKNTNTTSDFIPWDTAMNLIHRLYNDGEYTMSLLIGCGCFFGLRISDLLSLTWKQILNEDNVFTLIEKKTGKRRTIKINTNFKKHIQDCHKSLGIVCDDNPCFLSRKNAVYTTQRINVKLKYIKIRYGLKMGNISTHTLRKTFGRKVFESAGDQAELALVKLMELFNHSSVSITKRYLGLRQQELMETYDLLEF